MRILTFLVFIGMTAGIGCGSDGEHEAAASPDAAADATVSAGDAGIDGVPTDAPSLPKLPAGEMLFTTSTAIPTDTCNGQGPDFNIEIMRTDGTGRRSLPHATEVNTASDEYWPRLSPDRTRFLFYRLPVGRTSELCRYKLEELWIANIDGTGARRIFSNEQRNALATSMGWDLATTYEGHADWSPDGTHVVLVVGFAPEIVIPILAAGESQLFVLGVDDASLRQVTARKDSNGRGQTGDASFSNDGTEIIFAGCPDEVPAGCSAPEIRSVSSTADRATTTKRVYAPPKGGANDVYVSPTGTHLLWIEPADPFAAKPPKLLVAPYTRGTEIKEHQIRTVGTAFFASWTPDGSRIVYNDGWTMHSVGIDGSAPVQITPLGSTEAFALPSP